MKKVWRSAGIAAAFVAGGFLLLDGASAAQPLPGPAVGPNVNMASGTRWPEGDPLMTKRNEPSLGVSSRNPRHLLAGSNDYRLVAAEVAESLTDPEAWIQVYKSVDGGESWYSTPLPGCPLAITECTDLNAQGQPITGLYSGLLALSLIHI